MCSSAARRSSSWRSGGTDHSLTRANIATITFRRSYGHLYYASIHPSACNRCSANFALTEFSEVRSIEEGRDYSLNAWCELRSPLQQISESQPRTTKLLVEPDTEIVQ